MSDQKVIEAAIDEFITAYNAGDIAGALGYYGDDIIKVRNGAPPVPRHKEHKPRAAKECKIMLIEPAGTADTGDVCGERAAPQDVWI